MKNKTLSLTAIAVAFPWCLGAGELAGRVVFPDGSGPAVVFIDGLEGGILPREDAVITHIKGGRFEPPIVVGFVGNNFVFKNEDDTLHTTHLYLHLAYQERVSGRPLKNGATLYNIALPLAGMEVRRPIKSYFELTTETGFIDVKCNRHPEETATAFVFNHPYAAVTMADGSFRIPNLPSGSHDVWVWHAGELSKWKTVDVKDKGATEITVAVSRQ